MEFDYLAAYQKEMQSLPYCGGWITIGSHLPLLVEVFLNGDHWLVIVFKEVGRRNGEIGHCSFDPSFDARFAGQDWLQLPRMDGEIENVKVSSQEQLEAILNCCTRVLRMSGFW